MAKYWWSTKKYYHKKSLYPSDKAEPGSKQIKGNRMQQYAPNDSFTVKSKTQKTMDNFLLKKLNEQTNYKFEQNKTNSRPE